MKKILVFALLAVLVAGFGAQKIASANHSWGNYHWARTTNPFTIKLGDNLSSAWDAYLSTSSSDWSLSSVLDTQIVPGLSNPKTCKPVSGRVEICNSGYGKNGWLGIATIWASGGHITQGTVKMNDSYFKMAKYNTAAWKNLVLCQEIGHTLGLDHQDENFSNSNLGTCMDYTDNPTSNQHPNTHDYEMLETLYAHLDSTSTASQSSETAPSIDHDDPRTWGTKLKESTDKRATIYERDFGNGKKVFTFVVWAN